MHNKQLMDKYYHEDSFLRSKVIADKKLQTEVVQALQPLSLHSWDIDYQNMLTACVRSVEGMLISSNTCCMNEKTTPCLTFMRSCRFLLRIFIGNNFNCLQM